MGGRLYLALLTVATVIATGQPTSEQIDTGNSCSYAGDLSPSKVLAFASDSEAEGAVRRIVQASGLVQNFEIRAAGVSNAMASVDASGTKRYVLYSQTFMQEMRQATGSAWAALSVMAHEIGHHLNNHPLTANRDPKFEIDADYYSGFIMQRLGASLADAQAAVNYLPASNAKTHPAKHDRLAAIANGWTKACNDTSCDRATRPTTSVSPGGSVTPAPTQNPEPQGPNSCQYANDGTCDEPNLCKKGTDAADCKRRPGGANSCEYARDGSCDEPDICDRGTDTADCRSRPQSSQLYCCDGWGRKWCSITFNPGPPGTPCVCAGIPGSGLMCE
jgi:hypothetical protein